MDEGINAGEEEQRHHGTQGHHVVELRFQDATCVNFYPCAIVGIVQGICIWSRISETAGEVLWRNNTTIFWLLNICNTVTIYHFKKKTTNRLWVIQYVICAIVLNQSRLGGKKKKDLYLYWTTAHTPANEPPKKVHCYHGGGHEEVPWQKRSQPQDEKDNPHSIIPVKTNTTGHTCKFSASSMKLERDVTHLSGGELMAVIISYWWKVYNSGAKAGRLEENRTIKCVMFKCTSKLFVTTGLFNCTFINTSKLLLKKKKKKPVKNNIHTVLKGRRSRWISIPIELRLKPVQ